MNVNIAIGVVLVVGAMVGWASHGLVGAQWVLPSHFTEVGYDEGYQDGYKDGYHDSHGFVAWLCGTAIPFCAFIAMAALIGGVGMLMIGVTGVMQWWGDEQ